MKYIKREELGTFLNLTFFFLIGILFLFSLFTPLLKVDMINDPYLSLSENGFDFLSFSSIFMSQDFEGCSIVIGILSLIDLIISILLIILSSFYLIYYLKNKCLPNHIILNILFYVSFAMIILYWITGLVFVVLYNKTGYWIDGIGLVNSRYFKTSTLSYIPLIIFIFLWITYLILINYLKKKGIIIEKDQSKAEYTNKPIKDDDLIINQASNLKINNERNLNNNVTERESINVNNDISNENKNINHESTKNDYAISNDEFVNIMKKYKELLDANMLTQDEFNRLKENIMNKLK